MFSSSEFSQHRKFTEKDIEWVQNHSLLVIEAKKKGELPEIQGQPQYYAIWTKAVAYIATDGERIVGYYFSEIAADKNIIDCNISELINNEQIFSFSYENILSIKNSKAALSPLETEIIDSNNIKLLQSDDEIDLPESTLVMMRQALGRNAEGLGKLELVSRYLNTTDALLTNKLRYDIPFYIFNIPREINNSDIYIDDVIFPFLRGLTVHYFWEDYDRYEFQNDYLHILIMCENNRLVNFEIGYRVLDPTVSERIQNFDMVKKILYSNTLTLRIDDGKHNVIRLDTGHPKGMWQGKDMDIELMNAWVPGLLKMKAIEDYYEIQFKLVYIDNKEAVNELYNAVDDVYDGFTMNQNCEIKFPGNLFDEDMIFDTPTIFEEKVKLPVTDKIIAGVTFHPSKSYFLPSTANFQGKKENDIVKVPGCILYEISDYGTAKKIG